MFTSKPLPHDFKITKSCLSDQAILKYMEQGRIVISPFNRKNLSTSSYDVTLGEYYYRESKPEPGWPSIYNPYSEAMVNKVWSEYRCATCVKEWTKQHGQELENIAQEEKIIWVDPGETILAHTNEFIGGLESVTTMMKARSSLGRNFIEVCKCAGWGDVGYVNRWTMEITNNSQHYSIPLVVGRRIAQIIFFDTDGIVGDDYSSGGKYQNEKHPVTLRQSWTPDQMLPKMYSDREVVNPFKD